VPGMSQDVARPLSHQSTNDQVFAMVRPLLAPGVRVLDLGAGEGYFSGVVGRFCEDTLGVAPATILSACDVTPEIYRYPSVVCERLTTDGRLPYDDGTFDVVCSLEVLEHVEDQFAYSREVMRVLKPGGVAIISTPNVLNLNSRWRYLHSGFFTLFNPLPLSRVDVVHTSGHIHPVSYYYAVLAFLRAGAAAVSVSYDRHKRSAIGLLVLTWPLLFLGGLAFRSRLKRKDSRVHDENASVMAAMRSPGMLTARSVILRVTR
jgi:SAM-dependent methyltransferase